MRCQEGLLTGIEKGRQESILNLHKKGYKAPKIFIFRQFT